MLGHVYHFPLSPFAALLKNTRETVQKMWRCLLDCKKPVRSVKGDFDVIENRRSMRGLGFEEETISLHHLPSTTMSRAVSSIARTARPTAAPRLTRAAAPSRSASTSHAPADSAAEYYPQEGASASLASSRDS